MSMSGLQTVSSSSSPQSSTSHGCRKHCSAVALFVGSNSSIGMRKSASSKALRSSHWYFSISTWIRPHGFSFVMWRNSPADENDRIILNFNIHVSIRCTLQIRQIYTRKWSCIMNECSFFLSYLGWHMLPLHASAEACLTGWPNAQPQGRD